MRAQAAIRELVAAGRDAHLRVVRPPRDAFGLTHVHVTIDGWEVAADLDFAMTYNPEVLDLAIFRLISLAERRPEPTVIGPISCRCH